MTNYLKIQTIPKSFRALPLVENNRFARSSSVPPHFKPKAIKADLSRSKPKFANSSGDMKADKSKWAPVCVKAPPVSFGQP